MGTDTKDKRLGEGLSAVVQMEQAKLVEKRLRDEPVSELAANLSQEIEELERRQEAMWKERIVRSRR